MTIFEAYNSTKKKLEKAGIEDFVFEAKEIIKHVTGLNATQILANYNRSLSEYQENNLIAIVHQREVRYPLQYVFGEWDFYGRPFYVGPGVLVPRADTETVIEVCLEFLKEKQNPNVLDLCAGSGCIGITLAAQIPTAKVTMVEKYEEAGRYAKRNIERNKTANAEILQGDVFEKCPETEKYDLLVSNPPYIPQEEMNLVSPETKFEPETALLAEDGGLEFYKAITQNYKDALKSGGMLCFEIGFSQAESVKQILENAGFKDVAVKQDLNSNNRVVAGIIPE